MPGASSYSFRPARIPEAKWTDQRTGIAYLRPTYEIGICNTPLFFNGTLSDIVRLIGRERGQSLPTDARLITAAEHHLAGFEHDGRRYMTATSLRRARSAGITTVGGLEGYWSDVLVDGEKEGEAFVPASSGRAVDEWNEFFGIPSKVISFDLGNPKPRLHLRQDLPTGADHIELPVIFGISPVRPGVKVEGVYANILLGEIAMYHYRVVSGDRPVVLSETA